jgi:hypothetical protein
MNINLLKMFSGHVITISKMSESAKLQLLNYVEEGDEYQVKGFLLDGVIMKEPKDVICEEIIDQRFYASELPGKIKDFERYWTKLLS